MSECENQEHHMGYVEPDIAPWWPVYNDQYLDAYSCHTHFVKFNFCPNCGKELKEFYKEDEHA